MKQYLDTLRYILQHGQVVDDRTGVGTVSCFDVPPMVFNLRDGFPLLTTKKMFVRGIIEELLWFLRGSTDVRELQKRNVHIWDKNYEAYRKTPIGKAMPTGELGPIYGHQWRNLRGVSQSVDGSLHNWERIDQIEQLVHDIINTPHSRRLIVDAWNPEDLGAMALPPCHCLFQCYVRDEYLDLKLYQRSADMFLGVPFNIASYALLLMLLAHRTGKKPGKFIHVLGDAHIYLNHMEQVMEQVKREPRPLPKMNIDYIDIEDVKQCCADYYAGFGDKDQSGVQRKVSSILWDFYRYEHFHLSGYDPHPALKADMAV